MKAHYRNGTGYSRGYFAAAAAILLSGVPDIVAADLRGY